MALNGLYADLGAKLFYHLNLTGNETLCQEGLTFEKDLNGKYRCLFELQERTFCEPGKHQDNDDPYDLLRLATMLAGFIVLGVIANIRKGCCRCPAASLIPIDLFQASSDRWLYCGVFVTVMYTVAHVVTMNIELGFGPELDWLAKQVVFILTATFYYPAVAGIYSSHLPGYIITILALGVATRDVLEVQKIIHCWRTDMSYEGYMAIQLVQNLPLCLSFCVVSLELLRRIVTCIAMGHCQPGKTWIDRITYASPNTRPEIEFHMEYVKEVLKRRSQDVQSTKGLVFRRREVRGFKYSTGFLIVVTTSMLWLYLLCFLPLSFAGMFDLARIVSEFFPRIPATDFIKTIKISVYVTLYLTVALLSLSVYQFSLHYNRDMQALLRGETTWLTSSSTSPRSACMFIGYQIGYIIWGSIALGGMLIVVVVSLALVIFSLIQFEYAREKAIAIARLALTGVVLGFVLPMLIQVILIHFYFCERITMAGTKNKRILAWRNREGFFNYQYYAIFLNAALGFFSVARRIMMGAVFGLLFLARLDLSTLSRTTERFDAGYQSYLNFLVLENLMRNPIVHTFIHVVRDCKTDGRLNTARGIRSPGVTYKVQPFDAKAKQGITKPWARWKWHIAYTLVRNPKLLDYRKQINLRV